MPKKILLIDDKPDIIATLKDILSERGYEVISSYTGEEGLVRAEKESPDIVLIDTQMPGGINGFEVCAKIKKSSANIKIIIYTATIGAVDARKAKIAGADDYIVKTSDIDGLINAIKELLL